MVFNSGKNLVLYSFVSAVPTSTPAATSAGDTAPAGLGAETGAVAVGTTAPAGAGAVVGAAGRLGAAVAGAVPTGISILPVSKLICGAGPLIVCIVTGTLYFSLNSPRNLLAASGPAPATFICSLAQSPAKSMFCF